MAKKLLTDYENGEPVDAVFLVRNKELKTTRSGNLYMTMDLGDRTGSLPATFWDATEAAFAAFDIDDFIQVKGRVETYKNKLQINIKKFEKTDPASVQIGDFVPQTEKDINKMITYVRKTLSTIEDEHLTKLVNAFLEDTEFCKKFNEAPAAVSNHHAYLGGLLEHTASMLRLTEKVCECYPVLRRDLMLAGVFLHDIGKIAEFSYELSFQYTDAGGLLGHLVIGCMMVEEKAKGIDGFPRDTLMLLQHMILSHHGEFEYGSPKLPVIAEAIALHYIDNMDAKLNALPRMIEEDSNGDDNWTGFQRMFDRKMYKK
ncbi:MAG: HD domain-containing protein [Planctomycetes bacterium]|nr:HD domain-containing protein [Planctomycetota bacterium]